MKRSSGSYQRLDLFIKVLRVLCPNLTDASWIDAWGGHRLSLRADAVPGSFLETRAMLAQLPEKKNRIRMPKTRSSGRIRAELEKPCLWDYRETRLQDAQTAVCVSRLSTVSAGCALQQPSRWLLTVERERRALSRSYNAVRRARGPPASIARLEHTA